MTNKPTGEMHTPDPRVQAHTAQSATGEAAGPLSETWIGDQRLYDAADVDALLEATRAAHAVALAAKDVELARLRTGQWRDSMIEAEGFTLGEPITMTRKQFADLANIGRLAVELVEDDTSAHAFKGKVRNAVRAHLAANPTTATEEE